MSHMDRAEPTKCDVLPRKIVGENESVVRDKYPKDTFRIGWMVSDSHMADLKRHKTWIATLLKAHPNYRLVMLGDAGIDTSAFWPKEQVEWHPFADLFNQHYPVRAATLGLDVGICPLANTEFNKSKSPLKFAEYTAFGYPTIAQKMLPYTDVVLHGENGLLTDTDEQWIAALEGLEKSPELQTKLLYGAKTTLLALFDLKKVCKQWCDVFTEASSLLEKVNE